MRDIRPDHVDNFCYLKYCSMYHKVHEYLQKVLKKRRIYEMINILCFERSEDTKDSTKLQCIICLARSNGDSIFFNSN